MAKAKSEFEVSRESGAHAALARMAGDWRGEIRTWFMPGELADTSAIEGTVRLVHGGRFAVHEYRATLQGKPFAGTATHAYDFSRGGHRVAWVDEFHNHTAILFSTGGAFDPANPHVWSVVGTYPDGQGGPEWGWRTEVDVSGTPRRLVITHYNRMPGADEAKAVEIVYAPAASAARRPSLGSTAKKKAVPARKAPAKRRAVRAPAKGAKKAKPAGRRRSR